MRAVDIIRRKRDGGALSGEEIAWFVAGVTAGSIPDYQAVALLMAITLRGMEDDEIGALTGAMVASGERLDFRAVPGPRLDKHSTGGVGDKTSLVIAPVVAACGGVVPMMSGRGLGHTGGTLDKLEAIAGFRTSLDPPRIEEQLRRVGCAIVGQTSAIVPADRVLYGLRDVTATVDSVPLIVASIMSKKIAEGIDALVLDVKTGTGAFMREQVQAVALATRMVAIGTRAGVRTEALVTSMDVPLGRAVGNALEVAECVDVLQGRGPRDVEDLSVLIAARMLVLGGLAEDETAASAAARRAIASGTALERFRLMVEAQGGDPRVADDRSRLPAAPHRAVVPAPAAGFLASVDAEQVGRAGVALGAGRDTVADRIDPAVGVVLLAVPGDPVEKGQPVLELHYGSEAAFARARDLAAAAIVVTEHPPAASRLVRQRVTA
jgi:pyrimidine-nucleoside phosphorylase/thymidine phosphorylase